MKTWVAALTHIATSAAQAALGVAFFENKTPGAVAGNVAIQLGAQTALTFLQAFIAMKNSNTDPNGKPLVETTSGTFITSAKQ